MKDINFIEKEVQAKYGNISKLLTDILLLREDFKKVIQFPLKEFDNAHFSEIEIFCKQQGLNISKIWDSLSEEHKLIIFKDKTTSFYKSRLMQKNDEIRGELFGYPACCTAGLKTMPYKKHIFNYQNIIPLLGNRNTEIKYTNNFLLFDSNFRLFSHLPCSKDCKETSKLAREALKLIKDFNEEIYNQYVSINKSNIIFFEDFGARIFFQENQIFYTNKKFKDSSLPDLRIMLEPFLNNGKIDVSKLLSSSDINTSLIKVVE